MNIVLLIQLILLFQILFLLLYSELLLEEKDNLIKLREVIREYIKDKTASIKIVMLEEFAKSLDYILEKYDQNLTKNEK